MDTPPPMPNAKWRKKWLKILGLPEDCLIDGVEEEDSALAFSVQIPKRTPHGPCPECNEFQHWQHPRCVENKLRTVPLGGYHVLIRLRQYVWQCRCGYKWYQYPVKSSKTDVLLEQMATFGIEHSVSEVARQYAIDRSTVLDLIRPVLDRRVSELVLEPPRYIGLDVTRKAGIDMLAVVDLERGRHLELLLYQVPVLRTYLREVREKWSNDLVGVVIDPDTRLKKEIEMGLPGVPILLDRYHVQQKINSGITKFVASYKKKHQLPGNFYKLRHPKKDEYAVLAAKLRQDGHGILVDVHEYAALLAQVFQAREADTAREVWQDWREMMPPALHPYLHATIKNLNDNWLHELCATADHKAKGKKDTSTEVNVSNGVTESLHNRIKRIATQSPTLGFEMLRLRILLYPGQQDKEQRAKVDKANLRQVDARLKASLKDAKVKRKPRKQKIDNSPPNT